MAARIPIFSAILDYTTSDGDNIGAYSVVLVGPSGNSTAPQQFTYTRPPQEAVLGSSATMALTLLDSAVKDRL